MQSTEQTPIERYYAGLVERMQDVNALTYDPERENAAEIAARLDIDPDGPYLEDAAREAGDSMVYSVERLAVVEADGSMGELRSVELLLGGGGPTITLTADMRGDEVQGFTLWHSWGSGVGEEARMREQSEADRETVETFLQVIGATGF